MRLSTWMITAFVGTHQKQPRFSAKVGKSSERGSRSLNLFAPPSLPAYDFVPSLTSVDATTTMIRIQSGQKEPRMPSVPSSPSSQVQTSIREWLVPLAMAAETGTAPTATGPPTADEIKLLREAFATFYGVDRDLVKSEKLLSQAVDAWSRQPPDERAGLYRVRGDCYMALVNPKAAEKDYATAIDLLKSPGGELADPTELPTALLGRARAIRSQENQASKEQSAQAAKDYQLALRLTSREQWDTDAENEEDGAGRNPYAAWEWGSSLRRAGDLEGAAKVHALAAESFDDVGDKVRSIISSFDAGIDWAAAGKADKAKDAITYAIKNMKKVEGGEVDLLQRLLAKEGEARIALASVLWNSGGKSDAESMYGTACYRLDQLEADAQKRAASKKSPEQARAKFSIDDLPGAFDVSCYKFKNEQFVKETLGWPEPLQEKLSKLEKLGK